ncbi:MAG: ACP S-malonyltransferase [Ignavibacteria bacterium]|nr:ACP S-malonyltransferase [Ignavibacteria bacterium]
MSKIAFVFPGQGSQMVGMGKDLYENLDIAKDLYNIADEIMGLKLSEISFNGPAEELKQTNITQPALYVHSYILTKLIDEKITADCTAGHSLGEYTANAYAGTFSFEDGLRIVKTRGILMKNSGLIAQGTMAALIGLSQEQVLEICEKASSVGIVQAANFNCPGQIVISGAVNAVEEAMRIAKEQPYNCKIAKRLEVSGAFHSELMRTADNDFRTALDNLVLNKPRIPIYTNTTAEPIQDSENIRTALKQQLTSPVLWELSVKNMIRDGVTKFYEIGSGKVLSGLIKKISPEIETINISTLEDLKNLGLIN